ncbi:hypothetical protein BVRB_9g203740 [Beta vulgaris subsp. vulgaris]|nr:hypothetical protein BVRB_9g203740 [Beta vulgaris subsp. vulgaris]
MKMAGVGSNKLFQKLQLHELPLPGCSIKTSLKLFLQQKRKRQNHANSLCPYFLTNSTP